MRFIKRFWWAFLFVPIVLGIGFVFWASNSLGPMPEAEVAMLSDHLVSVETEQWFVFRPVEVEAKEGLIFYPGGRVDPRSYAPHARAIAQEGYLVVIVPMPLNLAVFSPNIASDVITSFPGVSKWVIGGHSLGGAMAANYVLNHSDQVQGLFFWAAYPTSGSDLSSEQILVASIYGTLDGVATPEEIEASQPLLPENTRWESIEGGNHAQFGWYGEQDGDNPAAISRETQQKLAVAATLELLAKVEETDK